MKTKLLVIIVFYFLVGCSNTGQTILTEFQNPEEEKASVSSGSTPTIQSKKFFPLIVSSEHTLEKNTRSQREEETFYNSQDRPRDRVLKTNDSFSLLFDTDKARDLINKYRKANNLKPLKLNPELTKAAEAHSKDLSNWDRISHYGSDGSNPLDRIKRTGYRARLYAENIGSGTPNFKPVFDGWIKSPSQNKNLLLSEATEMGLAVIENPKTEFRSFWTLLLAAPN